MSSIDYTNTQRNFIWLNSQYRFTHHGNANLIEIEELIWLPWYRKIFRTDGQDRIWKRIYFGHDMPIRKAIETFDKCQVQ